MTRGGLATKILVVGLILLGLVVGLAVVSDLRINTSPSYPLGVWRIEPLGRAVVPGDRIFICPPPGAVFQLARERGYLAKGLCPGWMAPLIKTVVAVAGQDVEIGSEVFVDGARLALSAVRLRDGQGRPLIRSAGGIVPAGQLFLFSDYEGSYDSRYFGPLPASGVLGLARPILVWNP